MSEEEGNYQVRQNAERTAIPPFVAPTGYIPNEQKPSQSSGAAGSDGSVKPLDCGAAEKTLRKISENSACISHLRMDNEAMQTIKYIGSDCCGHRFNVFGCEITIPLIGLELRSWGGVKWPHDLPDFFESDHGRNVRLTAYGASHLNRVMGEAKAGA